MRMNDLEPFVALATALKPWREQLVFVGGWAHRLHRLDRRALSNPGFAPIFTRDADVAFDDRARLEGDICKALLAAGFTEAFYGEDRPPVTRYSLGNEQGGFYAEFLTSLRGSGMKRDGQADATLRKAGISAQKLRKIEPLMQSPWEVTIRKGVGGAREDISGLKVPNPVMFIAQKVLIHDVRKRKGRASQDILYIHDTVQIFGDEVSSLAALWSDNLATKLSPEERAGVITGVERIFSKVTDDLRDAALIPQGRGLNPDEMRDVCDMVLNEIFKIP